MSIYTVQKGGTGIASVPLGKVLVGNGKNPVSVTKSAPLGNFVGTTDQQTISNKTFNISTLTSSAISSLTTPLSVAQGGTGVATFTTGNVLQGNGSSAITATKPAPTGSFVGDTDAQPLSNKTFTNATLTSLSSPLAVSDGGTGKSSVTLNAVLVGNGTGSLIDLLIGPSSPFVGTTDTQTLTSKTLSNSTITALSSPLSIANGGLGSALTGSNKFLGTDGSGAYQLTLDNVLPIASGGTGQSTFTNGKFITTNGTGTFVSTVDAPASDVVNETASQNISNKTFSTGTVISVLSSPLNGASGGTGVSSVTASRVPVTSSNALTFGKSIPSGDFVFTNAAQTLSNKTIASSTIGTLTTPLSVANGGLGATSFTANQLLVGNGTSAPTLTANPTSAFAGIDDAQTFTNKTITDSTNTVYANSLLSGPSGVATTSTVAAPSSGQIIRGSASGGLGWYNKPTELFRTAAANTLTTLTTTLQTFSNPSSSIGPNTFNANTLVAGSIVKFFIKGVISTAGPSTINFTVNFGATGSVPLLVNFNPGAAYTSFFAINGEVLCASSGATGVGSMWATLQLGAYTGSFPQTGYIGRAANFVLDTTSLLTFFAEARKAIGDPTCTLNVLQSNIFIYQPTN